MATVLGEGTFTDTVRRVLEYVQSRGIDLSGVVVEVVPDPSVTGAGAYTEHLGGLRFRIRYNPRYAGDPVLAAHEAGHVAYWTWQSKKSGKVQYVPDIDELIAEALGAVAARQLFGVPVTFKGAPLNLTKILPQRVSYITATVDGKTVTVKVPEWGDYMSRYRAGVFVSPYFYNMTNWSHVFGNFTATPADIIDTVYKAWREGAVEVVPGWGAVWRTTPTWSWPSENKTLNTPNTSVPSDTPPVNTSVTQSGDTMQKSAATVNNTATQVDVQKAVVYAQPSADVPLPPSNIQPPKYFSSDITTSLAPPPEWGNYISGRRVLVVFRNWPSLDTETLKDIRKDYVAGVGVVSEGRLRFVDRIPVPRVVDPNAWIELVDEKTGKVLARLKSDELYRLTNEGAPVTLYWSHVAVEEKWSGWERFVDRAKELDEKLGTWKPGTASNTSPGARGAVSINPDGTINAVGVANAPTEYVPPKVPDDVWKQFENILSDLKKLGEGVNLKNVGEVHDKFIQLRNKALDIARAYPQLIDKANETVERVGGAIRDASSKLYDALAKAAGRDSFWKGDGDVKVPIGVYKYDPSTGAFLLSLSDRPENIVGFIRDDGTPVVVKKTPNMSEALEEYNKLLQKPQTAGGFTPPVAQSQPTATQTANQQADFLQPLRDFLTNAIKTGASVVLTALGGGGPSPAKQAGDAQEFVQPPSGQQRQGEFVAVRPSRAPDYVLAEEEARRRSASTYSTALDSVVQTSSGYRPADYVVYQQSSGRSPYTTPSASPPVQLAETPQTQESSSSKRYRGRPVAVAV